MIYKFKLKNRFNVVLVLDKKNEEYFVLSENHKQYISGKFSTSDTKERIHHQFCIRSNEYSLVLDPDNNEWDNWSIFDEKKQEYLSVGGNI